MNKKLWLLTFFAFFNANSMEHTIITTTVNLKEQRRNELVRAIVLHDNSRVERFTTSEPDLLTEPVEGIPDGVTYLTPYDFAIARYNQTRSTNKTILNLLRPK